MPSQEFEFYVKADLRQYEGKYVAIIGDKVVASGYNAKEVFDEAKKKTGKIPTIAKIPREDALILTLKWK
ncbi:succinyl-CoA synthetase subunit alpha [Candidatus Woesearchaeota archaeon]|nr:succinyl-CoA synthetase subunit alpha [Candidatus Woesearchaeota archaeon]